MVSVKLLIMPPEPTIPVQCTYKFVKANISMVSILVLYSPSQRDTMPLSPRWLGPHSGGLILTPLTGVSRVTGLKWIVSRMINDSKMSLRLSINLMLITQ